MNREDLLKLLDLNARDMPSPESPSLSTSALSPANSTPPSKNATAFALDPWGLRRGEDLVRESERFRRLRLDGPAAADFHAAAFEPDPELLPDCEDPLRRSFLKELLQTPGYRDLHAATRLDGAASEIAAVHFAEQYAELRDRTDKEKEVDPELTTLRAVGKAVRTAREKVEECREAAAALGMGPGEPGSNDPQAIAALFKRVRADAGLRRIVDLAGRFRRLAQSKQRQKTSHGYDDLVGIAPGRDFGRLLPAELARLALPEFEWDALRRLAEGQMLCRDYRGIEPVGKGPVIACVDESGSMRGDKAETAKALALAVAWIARKQRRWSALVAYSGDTGERLLPLPPGRWDEGRLTDWLSEFIGGGSTLDVPVRELPRMYGELKAPHGQTDVVFVTDAVCAIPEEVGQRFREWKASAKARLIALVVNSPAGDLASIADELHLIPALGLAEAGVGRVLSI